MLSSPLCKHPWEKVTIAGPLQIQGQTATLDAWQSILLMHLNLKSFILHAI